MVFGVFENVDAEEKKDAIDSLIKTSSPSQDYFFMVILSLSMASLGVILDSIIIVIGSMLIAPVLYPVLGLGMGIAIFDDDLSMQSAYTLIQSIIISLLFPVLLGLVFVDGDIATIEIVQVLASTQSFIMYFLVAIIAGVAASLSLVKPTLSESFPGIAVAVSLVPPLALAGLAGSQLNVALTSSMITLFSANVIGITLASAIVFWFMKLHVKKRYAEKTVHEEQEAIEEENQEA